MNGVKGFQLGNTEARKKGKHKKTIEKEMELEYIRERIREEIEPIIDALISKAKDKDMPAIKETLERLVGKTKESLDITSGGKELLTQEQIYELLHSRAKENRTGGKV